MGLTSEGAGVERQGDTAWVRERIIELRRQLVADGCDAGPVAIAWHLEREGPRVPSTSTIRRILSTAGLIIPEPTQTPEKLLRPIPGCSAERDLAIRRYPLAAFRRQRGEDPQLAG